TPTWNILSQAGTAPGYIQRAVAFYDPVGDRMVVTGGYSTGATWALSLGATPTWEQLPTCPATDLGPTYDPLQYRALALGSDKQLYELSLATPTAWRALTTDGAGPASINDPAMFFDAAANRAFTLPQEGYGYTYAIALESPVDVPGRTPRASIELRAAMPNPASEFSTVRLSLAHEEAVVLDVFDMNGRRVRGLV